MSNDLLVDVGWLTGFGLFWAVLGFWIGVLVERRRVKHRGF